MFHAHHINNTFRRPQYLLWYVYLFAAVALLCLTSFAYAQPLDHIKVNGQDVKVEDMSSTPVPGLYRLRLAGGTVVYSDANAHYLLTGDMYENTATGLVNLSDIRARQERKEALAKLSPQHFVDFRSASGVKGSVIVFTDVTCTYCQAFHNDVPSLNQQGIEVRYLPYPRAGEDSPAAAEMAQVWCSRNAQESLNNAIGGQAPNTTAGQCTALVNQSYELGKRMGVKGTPTIIYADGTLQNGYLSQAQLIQQAKQHQ